MTPFSSFLILGGLALSLGLILILPAVREWLQPEDALPLPIDNSWARKDTVFAERFHNLADGWWADSPGSETLRLQIPAGQSKYTSLLVQSIESGPEVNFKEEIWAREQLLLGASNQARALLSDGIIKLGPGSVVERWVHADRTVHMEHDCIAKHRVTALGKIRLDRGCQAQLVSAPTIEWSGEDSASPLEIPTDVRHWGRRSHALREERPSDSERSVFTGESTVFLNGDIVLEEEAEIEFSLVVRGNLYIRKGALIAGNLKAHGDLVIENAAVTGTMTCGGRMVIGSNSTVQGCLMGNTLLWLGSGVVVGRPDRLQAVCGGRVFLAGEGVVHGRIRAVNGLIEVQR